MSETVSEIPSRTCPVCRSGLVPYDHEGVQLDRCPTGCGLWLDRGELPQVVHAERAPRDEQERLAALESAGRDIGQAVVADAASDRRSCPVCGGAMRLGEYAASGIAIDECMHGIWLDAGELEQIEAYAEGIRSGTRTNVGSDGSVRGIAVPPDILASITRAAVPVPPASSTE